MSFDTKGRHSNNSIARNLPIDLFFATEKREGWTNLYKNVDNSTYPGDIYDSKAEAKKEIDKNNDYVTTIKIKWEE